MGRVESRSRPQSHDWNTFNGSVRELQQVRDIGNWEHHPHHTTPAHRLCVKLICSFPPARPCSCRCRRRTKQALLCLLRRHYVCFRLLAASGNKGPSEETRTVVSRNQTRDLCRPSNGSEPRSADQILGSSGLRQTSSPASCLF